MTAHAPVSVTQTEQKLNSASRELIKAAKEYEAAAKDLSRAQDRWDHAKADLEQADDDLKELVGAVRHDGETETGE